MLFAVIAIPAAHAITVVFPGGSVTTGLGAWDGGSGTIYDDTHVSFDVTKADLVVTVYGIDMTQSRFPTPGPGVYAGWPAPLEVAGIQVGVTQQTAFGSPWINPSSSAFSSLLVAGGGGPIGSDYYLTQTAYTDAASNLYENKSTPWDGNILGQGFNTPYLGVIAPLGGVHCTGNPLYDTFDMQLTFHYLASGDVLFTPLIRVYATTDPFSYPAMVWLPTFPPGSVFVIPGAPTFDWTNVKPFVFVGNWGAGAGGGTITWNSVQATGSTNYYLKVTSAYGTTTGAGWYGDGTTAYAGLTSGTVPDGVGKQHVFTTWTWDASGTNYLQSNPITMDKAKEAIAQWKTQWYITVNSAHGAPYTASAWVDDGTDFTASVTSPDVVSAGHEWVCTGYKIDGGALTAGTSYKFTAVNAPHTIQFFWNEQFLLTVTSPYDTPTGAGWYAPNTLVTSSVTSPVLVGSNIYSSIGWTGTGSAPASGGGNSVSFTITTASSVTWKWNSKVGGEWAPIPMQTLAPINTLMLLAPWIALGLIAAASAVAMYRRLLKKHW
jgi:hypothetical protein